MSRSIRCKGSRRGLLIKIEGVKEDFLEEGIFELSFEVEGKLIRRGGKKEYFR